MGLLLKFTEMAAISHSELKILAKYNLILSVICAHMVDFHRPSPIYFSLYCTKFRQSKIIQSDNACKHEN